MLLKDCMMLVKSFLKIIKNEWRNKTLFCLFLLKLVVALSVLGCSNTPKNVRGVWKTVLKGDWSAHLYDVHFISETQGWAVGNSVGISFGHEFEETKHEKNRSYTDGAESIILRTDDGGKNWNLQHSGIFGKPLRSVYFRNASEGWSVGEGGVLIHTTDGGQTWTPIKTGTENNLHDLFMDEVMGWIVGDWGTLLKTTDGGKTFQKVDGSAFGEKSLKGIYFVDNSYGWIISYSTPNESENSGSIYHTTDGGQTWNEQLATKTALFSGHFLDKMTGWVVGDQRTIYATTDGGKKWDFVTPGSNKRHTEKYGQPDYLGNEPLHTFTLYDVDFADNQHGWIVGDLGVILRTTTGIKKDGSSVWKHQRGGPRFHNSADGLLLGVDFVSKKLGWAVGENGTILHTRNGGVTWEAQSSPTHLLFDVCIVAKDKAYVVGDRGTILQTHDGGTKWQAQDSRTAECFGATHFVSPQKGWAVAETGVILRTTNGGAVWQRQTSRTKQDLLAVFFIDEKTGWSVGSAGEIVHTSDGGKTWSRQQSGVPYNLFDIHFISKQNGWVVGLFGTLLSTVDGGNRWQLSTLTRQLTKMEGHNNIWLNAVYFVSPQFGWVVGENGAVFHTDDGGKSWFRQQSHTQNFLYDVFFISKEEGWIVGKEGLVLHTTDSGKNWRPQRTDTRTDLTSIHMSNRHSGLVTGQGGTILKYEVVESK